MLQKFYKWDASIDRHVRKAFLAQAGIRYTDMVSKFKSNRTSTGKPACIHEDTWRIWEAYWERPDVKAKSEQQRKNRMNEVAGPGTGCSRHTGGSRSAIEHYHKLREELQKEPNLFECFEHMHKKKNGAFVDERSKKIARIYGLGTKASSFINDNSCSSSATSQFHQDTMKEMLDTMRVEMEAQMEAKLEAERTQMQAKLQAERTKMQTQMQAQIASLMDELRRNGIIPTTSTPQPPTTEGHSVNSNDEDLGDD
nr:ABC transporter B family member 11 [Ipomoea batatas]